MVCVKIINLIYLFGIGMATVVMYYSERQHANCKVRITQHFRNLLQLQILFYIRVNKLFEENDALDPAYRS